MSFSYTVLYSPDIELTSYMQRNGDYIIVGPSMGRHSRIIKPMKNTLVTTQEHHEIELLKSLGFSCLEAYR
jgi:hypothetical protein